MREASNQDSDDERSTLIAVVGPCAAGKTTLIEGLVRHGFKAHASFESCTERKQLNWAVKDYERQKERLTHARQHCDIYLDTEGISAEEALEHALEALKPLLST
jgi:guanylate kinase